MTLLYFILLLLAVACFLASSVGVNARVGLMALGLALVTAAFMLQHVHHIQRM